MRRAPQGCKSHCSKIKFLRFEMVGFIAKFECQSGAIFLKNKFFFFKHMRRVKLEIQLFLWGQVLPGWQAGHVELASEVFTQSGWTCWPQ